MSSEFKNFLPNTQPISSEDKIIVEDLHRILGKGASMDKVPSLSSAVPFNLVTSRWIIRREGWINERGCRTQRERAALSVVICRSEGASYGN